MKIINFACAFILCFLLTSCSSSSKNEQDLEDIKTDSADNASDSQDTGADIQPSDNAANDEGMLQDIPLKEDISPQDVILDDGKDISDIPVDHIMDLDIPKDTSCKAPSFSENCIEVTEFQCGFMAQCTSGKITVQWHHHYFCNDTENIEEFSCSYECPGGCDEGTIEDWPQNGQILVEKYCKNSDCAKEGESVPVIPDAPECCSGLIKIPCDKPDNNGDCKFGCDGASICANCGNGICGPGENKCNCPDDCGTACAEINGKCKKECAQGEEKVNGACEDAGNVCCYGIPDCTEQGYACKSDCSGNETEIKEINCGSSEKCCKPAAECLTVGQGFMDFNTEGKCCQGLTAKSDCDIGDNGCICKKCPCMLCLECGDKICGPYEHNCNCPEDCPTKEKNIPTQQSKCEGEPYDKPEQGKLKLTPSADSLLVEHSEFPMNCCMKLQLQVIIKASELYFIEKTKLPYTPCFCECLYTISGELTGIKQGTYTVKLYNEDKNKVLFEQNVEIK
jgi:hypothetical protein